MIEEKSQIAAFTFAFSEQKNKLWDKFAELRYSFVEQLANQQFPTTRDEYWKYTRISKIAKSNYQFLKREVNKTISNAFIPENALENNEYPYLDVYRIILKNGINVVENTFGNSLLLDENKITIKRFGELSCEELTPFYKEQEHTKKNIFHALNSAYFSDGILIEIHEKLDKPLHIIHDLEGNNVMAQPKIIIQSKPHAEATIIQTVVGNEVNNVLFNLSNEIFVGENSNLTVLNIQQEPAGVFHLNNTQVYQEKNSRFTAHHYTLTGNWVRNNTNIVVNGENCESNLYGAYLAQKNQHIDNHTIIDHAVPNCISNELYKGTATDKATIVFNGKVFVRKNAQKINAFQSNNNILLSDSATVNSKPELEIYADDVKCSHGSTTGQLDEEALFYLKSRGLSNQSANNLLVGAFVGEVIEKMEDNRIKNYIKKLVGLA